MKASLGLLLLWTIYGLLAGCSDSRSNDTAHLDEHAGAHPSTHTGSEPDDASHSHRDSDPELLWAAAAANKVVISDQGTLAARRIDTTVTVKGYGLIVWDERRNRKVTVRTGGRVERLYVRYPYQFVRAGQKVLELYTPELTTYAAEYLHHLQTPGDEALVAPTRRKLTLLGVTGEEILKLEKTGRLPATFSVYSHYGGYALMASGPGNRPAGMPGETTQGGMSDAMGGGSDPAPVTYGGDAGEQSLREGMYVNRGQTLFYVNDFAVAWGVLSFDAGTQPLLKRGMDVVIRSELLPLPIRSTVAFIEPSFDGAGQKFMQARVYLPNSARRLKVNSLIEGSLDIPLNGKVILPAAAVLSLGKRTVVWVKKGETATGKNVFEVREVQLSLLDHHIAVVEGGLSPSEQIAAHGGYLLDNQSLVEP
ncbi:MAG TPA: efflux RND transporter periplasmic adaptor subunit [Chitinophagaceae bacterium]